MESDAGRYTVGARTPHSETHEVKFNGDEGFWSRRGKPERRNSNGLKDAEEPLRLGLHADTIEGKKSIGALQRLIFIVLAWGPGDLVMAVRHVESDLGNSRALGRRSTLGSVVFGKPLAWRDSLRSGLHFDIQRARSWTGVGDGCWT